MRAVVFAAIVVVARGAVAQTDAERATRRELISHALQARSEGRHPEALDLAQRAAQIGSSSGLRRFVAEEDEQVGRLADAYGAALACIDEAHLEAPSANRTVVEAGCVALRDRLAQRVGRITVRVPERPPSDLAISVDGHTLATALWNVPNVITPGTIGIEATAAGYAPFRRYVDVNAGTSMDVEVALERAAAPAAAPPPAVSNVLVRVAPVPGAPVPLDLRVAIDDTPIAPSVPASMPPGTHTLAVSGTGVVGLRQRFVALAGMTVPITVALQPLVRTGELAITTRDGRTALLSVDGEVVGTAPIVLRRVAPGPHMITADWRGHASVPERADVVAGERREIVLTLPVESVRRATPSMIVSVLGFSVGAVAVIVGIGAAVGSQSAYDATTSMCATRCSVDYVNGQQRNWSTLDTLANATILPGALLMVGSAVLFFALPRSRSVEHVRFAPNGVRVEF